MRANSSSPPCLFRRGWTPRTQNKTVVFTAPIKTGARKNGCDWKMQLYFIGSLFDAAARLFNLEKIKPTANLFKRKSTATYTGLGLCN